jgi:molybdate/tungstate transport system substrate-binding protein
VTMRKPTFLPDGEGCAGGEVIDAANPAGASRFVGFLLGPQGRAVMQDHGLDIVKPSVSGDASKMPPQIHSEVDAAK